MQNSLIFPHSHALHECLYALDHALSLSLSLHLRNASTVVDFRRMHRPLTFLNDDVIWPQMSVTTPWGRRCTSFSPDVSSPEGSSGGKVTLRNTG